MPHIQPDVPQLAGALTPYADSGRGWRILRPNYWNQFDQIPGVYDLKWTDIVSLNKQDLVVSTVPTKATSVASLGNLEALGKVLGQARGDLVAAKGTTKEGISFATFEFKGPEYHHLLEVASLFHRVCVQA